MGNELGSLRGREHRLLIEAVYSYGGDREDRLTEVLASVLETHHEFCRLLARRLGLQTAVDHLVPKTQVGPKGQRRLVDLALTALDPEGATQATIFVECKYNPTRKPESYWFSEDQANRQRHVLYGQPGQHILAGICSKGDFDRLTGPVDRRPAFDPRAAYDTVITWSEIRELGRAAAGGGDWERRARSASAPASERMLLEFLTYLDLEGEAMGALADDDVFVLARHAQTMDRLDRLLWRSAEKLAERMDAEDELEFEMTTDDEDELAIVPRVWIASEAPGDTWVSDLRDGGLFIMIAGAEYDDEEEVGTPTLYAGVGWDAGRAGKKRTSGSNWEKGANEAGLAVHWEGNDCSLVAARPLQEIADAGNTIARQADILATWAHQSITIALGLPAPPDATQDEEAEAA